MMTFTRFAHVALFAIAVSSATISVAADDVTTRAKCLLEVKGVKYITGTCDFTSIGGGSFILTGKGYFAYFHISTKIDGPVTVKGSWNEIPAATHAHTSLGQLVRDDACWSNETAKACAWKIDK